MLFDNPFTEADRIRVDWNAVTPQMYADGAFEGIRALHTFQRFYLEPLLLHGLINQNEREQALIEMYYRIVGYLSSIRKLNSPLHFQTIAASARSLFELGLDMALFNKDSTNECIDRLHAFTKIERYRFAKTTVDFFSNHPLPKGEDISVQREVCANPTSKSEVETLITKYWTQGRKGQQRSQKINYPSHWSKFQDARSRARSVGGNWEERYVLTYSILSWHIHAGLTGVSGLAEDTFHTFAMDAFQLSYDVVLDCFRILGREFHLTKATPQWADRLFFLDNIILLAIVDKCLIARGEPSRLVYLEEHELDFFRTSN